jgi:hypothetical protein
VHESAQPQGGDVVFDQKMCVFLTHVAGVQVGQTLAIKNSDNTSHNTNIVGTGFNPIVPALGNVPFAVQTEMAIPWPVACSIHPWMKAYILPRKNGYFAVTDADGSFKLENLPAGEPLEFQVWHESGGGRGNSLVLNSPKARTELKWTNAGRMSVQLAENETRNLEEIVVPAAAFR